MLSLTFPPSPCRSFYYDGPASAISYRRDDAHISSVGIRRGARWLPLFAGRTAAPFVELGPAMPVNVSHSLSVVCVRRSHSTLFTRNYQTHKSWCSLPFQQPPFFLLLLFLPLSLWYYASFSFSPLLAISALYIRPARVIINAAGHGAGLLFQQPAVSASFSNMISFFLPM